MEPVRNVIRDTIPQKLERWAQEMPTKSAWHWYDDNLKLADSYTYQELDLATSHLADYLRNECGLKTGDVVILCFLPGLPFTVSLLACFKAGVVGVPVYPPDPTKAGKELLHFATIAKDCGAKVALTHNLYHSAKQLGTLSASVMSFFSKREATWPDLKWFTVDSVLSAGKTTPKSGKVYERAELGFLQYTSGSTSAPKGVMVSMQNLSANLDNMTVINDGFLKKKFWSSEQVMISWLPQYHDMGLIGGFMMAIWHGCAGHYMSPITFLRSPLHWMRLMARSKASFAACPNFAFGLVLRRLRDATPEVRDEIKSLDLTHMEVFLNGAEPLEIQLFNEFLNEFEKQGLRKTTHSPCYGLAEFTLTATGWGTTLLQVEKNALLNERRVAIVKETPFKEGYTAIADTKALVSCGLAVDAETRHVVRVVNPESGEDLGEDRIGEIWLNSDSVTRGYWGRDDINEDIFRAKIVNCKVPEYQNLPFLRTGDLGFLHNNELFYTGRIKDVIIINGLNYYPQDIERAAEASNSNLSAGRSAAFAVRGEDGVLTDSCVIVAELKMNVDSSLYAKIVEDILFAVSRECSLYLQGIYLIQPKTILKTTSGKISRNFNAEAYAKKTLKIMHQWEDFESSPIRDATAATATVSAAVTRVLSVEEIQEKIVNLLRTVGNVGEQVPLDKDTNLMAIGLQSAVLTELSVHIGRETNVTVRPMMLFSCPTLGALSERVQQLQEQAFVPQASSMGASPIIAQQVERTSTPSSASDEESDEDNSEVEEVRSNVVYRPQYEAHIAGWGTANPLPFSTERFLEVEKEERRRLGQSEETINQMVGFMKASQIQQRYSCHPYWLRKGEKVEDFPDAVGVMNRDIFGACENHIPKYADRLACYQETVFPLCLSAAEKALKKWGQDKQLITHIITTCTSGWSEPGIGCAVIKGLGLREDIQKQELNFNGCFCGASCLRIARDFIRAGDATAVLVVACEVASTMNNFSYTDPEHLVMLSLFADGAAAVVVAREGIWRFDMTGSSVVPDSSKLLGLRPPIYEGEESYVMTLSKFVGPSLYKYFTSGTHGKEIMKKLYDGREQKPALAIHPGGPRILEAMGDVFGELGFENNALDSSYHTFRNFGNLGAAAMLFVLSHRLDRPEEIKEDSMITMAFGPGVTVEWAKLVRSTPADRARLAKGGRSAAGALTLALPRSVSNKSSRSKKSSKKAVVAERIPTVPSSPTTEKIALMSQQQQALAPAAPVKEINDLRTMMQRVMMIVLLQALITFAALAGFVLVNRA